VKARVSLTPFYSESRIDDSMPYTETELHVLHLILTNPAVVAISTRCQPPPGDYTVVLHRNTLVVSSKGEPLFEAELTRRNNVMVIPYTRDIDEDTALCILSYVVRETLARAGEFKVIVGDD